MIKPNLTAHEQDDRREHTRYSTNHIKVLVKPAGPGGADWELGEIPSVDFSRNGIALETDCPFAVGDLLQMIIRTDDASITEVAGVICNRVQCPSGYRFGVRFEYDDSKQGHTIADELLLLEREAAEHVH